MEGKKLINSWALANMADMGISWAGLKLTTLPEWSPFGNPMVNNGDMINYFIIKIAYAAALVGMYGLASVANNEKFKWDFVFEKLLKYGNGIIWVGVGLNALQVTEELLKIVK